MTTPIDLSGVERAEFDAARGAVMAIGRETARMEAVEIISRLVDEADDLGSEGADEILKIAGHLQEKRAFGLMLILCLMAGRSGLATMQLKQKEIQALIELGRLREAIRQANALADAADVQLSAANSEAEKARIGVWKSAKGNVGRAYKQLYVNAMLAGRTPDPVDLRQAARAYLDVWDRAKDEGTTYQAINAAALISRGVRDKVRDSAGTLWAREEDARKLASVILDIHRDDLLAALQEGSTPGDMWTLATCGEAYLVLGMMEDAARCYGAYAGNPANTAFNLASSLRQLQQIWGFSGDDRSEGGQIVRLLKAALINLDKSVLADGERPEDSVQTESVVLSVTEARLIESDLGDAETDAAPTSAGFEAYLGKRASGRAAGAMIDVSRMIAAVRRARSLCAIETVSQGGWARIGTGFVVDGDVLNAAWKGHQFIVTNHHVTSGSDKSLSSSFQRCRAVFVDIDPLDNRETSHVVEFQSVVWESPENAHDTAVLKPAGPLPAECTPLTVRDMTDYLPKRREEDRDGTDMHVVILGFPGGGELSYSFGDEMMLDHDACPPGQAVRPPLKLDGRPVKLHYRTPSLPGSSGSPVFEAGTWRLVGIHHRGRPDTPRLHPKKDTYEANEGIWLASIRAAIAAGAGPDAEFLSARAAATIAVGAAMAGQSAVDLSKQVFAKPIGAPAQPAVPAGFPGNYIPSPDDRSDIQRQYLRQGMFTSDLDQFRASAGGFETVIGDDNRTQIHHTTSDPFRMICSLVIRMKGGFTNYGTGWLIGRRTLITAGHVLLAYEGAPEVEAIEVRPGRSGQIEPFESTIGTVMGQRFSVHPAWSERFDPLYDIGAIHLGADIGDALGWFRVGALNAASLERRWCHVTGYPGDKLSAPGMRAPLRAAEMWHHATPIAAVNARQVFYPADTYAGQSGAPVYILDDDGRARVVAVHAYGTGAGAHAQSEDNNSGVLLDAAMLQVLADWRAVE